MHFWRLSFTLLARHLCRLFCYQVSCISANITSSVVLVFKGQEILSQSFLVRLGENFLEFCFQLVYFFLDGKDNNSNKNSITVHPPSPQQLFRIEINSSETYINNVQVFLNGHLSHVR